MSANRFETEARQRKAIALVDTACAAFDGEGIPAAEIEGWNEGQWKYLSDAAGTSLPSPTTRALVLSSLRVREKIARKVEEGRQQEEGREAAEVFAKLAAGSLDDPRRARALGLSEADEDDPFAGL